MDFAYDYQEILHCPSTHDYEHFNPTKCLIILLERYTSEVYLYSMKVIKSEMERELIERKTGEGAGVLCAAEYVKEGSLKRPYLTYADQLRAHSSSEGISDSELLMRASALTCQPPYSQIQSHQHKMCLMATLCRNICFLLCFTCHSESYTSNFIRCLPFMSYWTVATCSERFLGNDISNRMILRNS